MVERQENVFYYITLLNENYAMPGLKPGTEAQIIKGMYLLEEGAKKTPRVQAAGLGHHPARVDGRQGLLEADWGVAADVWSCPSFNELARDGQDASAGTCCTRRNAQGALRHRAARRPRRPGDRLHRLHEELRRADPRLHSQGPHLQGAGHRRLRPQRLPQQAAQHFEVNRHYIVVAALKALADEGSVPATKVAEAIAKYGINADKINPLYA
jgi:pyruvate dehydrogenase E1 component